MHLRWEMDLIFFYLNRKQVYVQSSFKQIIGSRIYLALWYEINERLKFVFELHLRNISSRNELLLFRYKSALAKESNKVDIFN